MNKGRPIQRPIHNFIETLLVNRVEADTGRHAESGVAFKIVRDPSDANICVLIKVDAKDEHAEHLFDVSSMRPDYLCLYLSGDGCIGTIIETKGNDVSHAIDQIVSGHARIKEELSRCLPRGLNIRLQGVVVYPSSVQVPIDKLKQANKVLSIDSRPCPPNSAVDLSEIVSGPITPAAYKFDPDRGQLRRVYESKKKTSTALNRQSPQDRCMETVVSRCAERIPAVLKADDESIISKSGGNSSIVIRYNLTEGAFVVLYANSDAKHVQLHHSDPDNEMSVRLRNSIREAGLNNKIVSYYNDQAITSSLSP